MNSGQLPHSRSSATNGASSPVHDSRVPGTQTVTSHQGIRPPHPQAILRDGGASVLNKAENVEFISCDFKHGAFCAVGGTQSIHVNTQLDTRTAGYRYDDTRSKTGNRKPDPDPSVLNRFRGSDSNSSSGSSFPQARFGAASYSAVAGDRHVRTESGSRFTAPRGTDPAVGSGMRHLPPPVNGEYHDGTHSAVSGYQGAGQRRPNVLSETLHLLVRKCVFEDGSFSAVSKEQEIIYRDGAAPPKRHPRS